MTDTFLKVLASLAIRETQIKATLRVHLTPGRMARSSNARDSSCWQGCGARGALLHCWWDCKLVQPRRESQWQLLRNKKPIYLKTQLSHSWAYTQRTVQSTTRTLTRPCSPLLFITARNCKQLRCASNEEWIKKMWYIYTVEYYSTLKKK